MIREIVKIDEELCDGCGLCIPNCHEGALQIIDGKARLVSDLMCDGLGACLGHCPVNAITIEKREAEAYNEVKVMKDMVNKGKNTVIAHLQHLKDHNEKEFLKEGIQFLLSNREKLNFEVDDVLEAVHNHTNQDKQSNHKTMEQNHQNNHQDKQQHEESQACACPGSATKTFGNTPHQACGTTTESMASALSHWPIQMHLINPTAGHFRKSDFVLAADCVAFSLGAFHSEFLQGKTLAIACPKLDQGTDIYIEKIKALIDDSGINTLTVMVMEVPCCNGLLQMVQVAMDQASRRVPVKRIMVSVEGNILNEEWV
ncbi:MAG: 4Fe-4S binding protein [Bacteroidales bacterium]|nr:4Fe-4S binding protein [Bacteroidales bacterium]